MSQARFFSLNWAQWGLVGIFLVGGGAVMTNIWKSNTCKGSCCATANKTAQNTTDTINLAEVQHTGSSPEFPASAQANSEQAGREVASTSVQEAGVTAAPAVQAASLNPLTASQSKKTNTQTQEVKTVAPKMEVKTSAPVISNKREIAPVAANVSPTNAADYHLIAASADSWKKAGVFKENLKKQGFNAEILHTAGTSVYRVSIFKSGDRKKVEEMKAKTKVAGTWIAQ